MDWREHIHSVDGILGGKPVFRGTRVTVERILKLVGAGWTYGQIADEYPEVQAIQVMAAASFAAELMHDESYIAASRARAA
jgi:uncharacterized protein (DUF433 family)